ncbi:MAG: hypothetical protein HOJ16_00020 [Candidatus Peribacter sp.]|jgi:hypothetical protein|nr:hypothetical protein [Candidatus Peribacter sp.]
MNVSDQIENVIEQIVNDICSMKEIPTLPDNIITTDNLGEVVEKLVILHIRTWMLEDAVGVATTDSEIALLKKKIDICFKQKRPAYVEAINRMVENSIISGRSLVEDSVKSYDGHE